jgi:isopenicillin N synthase-like dioxygenase
MFQVLTNGLYTPTLHRVVHTDPTRSRVSIAYFHEPGFEALVEPLPQLVAPGAAPLFSPVRYGAHLESKVLSNFELEEKDASTPYGTT